MTSVGPGTPAGPAGVPRRRRGAGATGASLVETLVALALVGLLASYAASDLVRWRARQEVEAALRHVDRLLERVCVAAAASGRAHGIGFDAAERRLQWTVVADGDGDGIGSADLDAGIDAAVEAPEVLGELFPGVEPGRPDGAPTVMGGAADRNGLAFGRTTVVSCSAGGGARAGTLYLRGAGGRAGAALRIYGPTGRTSLWWWEPRRGGWIELR